MYRTERPIRALRAVGTREPTSRQRAPDPGLQPQPQGPKSAQMCREGIFATRGVRRRRENAMPTDPFRETRLGFSARRAMDDGRITARDNDNSSGGRQIGKSRQCTGCQRLTGILMRHCVPLVRNTPEKILKSLRQTDPEFRIVLQRDTAERFDQPRFGPGRRRDTLSTAIHGRMKSLALLG
jgi:hypothetical protein